MAKGKIHHWKHGWIPLDAYARSVVAKRQGQKTFKLTDAPTVEEHKKKVRLPGRAPTDAERSEAIARELAKTPAQIRAEERAAIEADKLRKLAAEGRKERYRKVTTVDGVDFVSFKSQVFDPLGTDNGVPREWTPEQMQVVADAYNEVKSEFPGLKPVQFVGTDQGSNPDMEDVLAVTSWDGTRISVLGSTFSDADRNKMAADVGPHGAIAGQFTGDPEAFSRAVIVHELGHALQMQKTSAKRRGEIIAREKVTPADFGMKLTTKKGEPPKTAPRWAVDTLDNQTVYGLGNEYEWFAEAFAEGWYNGPHATDQAKRVMALLHDEYGKARA